ncbi:MAG: FAD-dependent monooxygenase [Moraxellaceae bacterium]|nr:FAD-dependent monooxygenase [Moraxellaceae bacterium]
MSPVSTVPAAFAQLRRATVGTPGALLDSGDVQGVTMQPQRIAIIGAGTAGLASAIVLARQGHAVTLFEQSPLMSTVGAGILLQPSGMAVFRHLGVLDDALALGARVTALRGRLANGTLLIDSAYREACAEHFGLGLHRASLCHVLLQALQSLPVTWHMGATVTQLDVDDDGAAVAWTGTNGSGLARFDLALVANGARSPFRPREWVLLDEPYPWGAVWAILPECGTLPRDILHQYFHGAARMMGILPTGAVPEAPRQPLTSLFWSVPAAELDAWQGSDAHVAAFKAEVRMRWPAASGWIDEAVQGPAQFLPARYRDVVMTRFGAGRLGVLGDAAHAMSPQLGQGVNMALLDAWALGQAMQETDDLDALWARYHALRLPSVRFYQFMSRALTPFYQSHSRALGLLRDLAFPWMYRMPWLRREMARTVSGIKAGPFAELSLEAIAQPVPGQLPEGVPPG